MNFFQDNRFSRTVRVFCSLAFLAQQILPFPSFAFAETQTPMVSQKAMPGIEIPASLGKIEENLRKNFFFLPRLYILSN